MSSSSTNDSVKEQIQEFVDAPKNFFKDGMQFVNRCTKPDQREFLRICQAVGMGFAALGALGFIVKLIHIPINNILVGAA
ncbi:protein translocase SEC61 complex gamma subunit [Umbelopsis sp. PMI_123]|nr:protein translocase SEC61 complex gamma subunit [Umbelopsis sp. PMI_123]